MDSKTETTDTAQEAHPLPWHTEKGVSGYVIDSLGEIVCITRNDATAERIIDAVNRHAEGQIAEAALTDLAALENRGIDSRALLPVIEQARVILAGIRGGVQ